MGARLYAATSVGLPTEGVEVALIDDRSRYRQIVRAEGGLTVVEQRLELVARQNDAQAWLEPAFVSCAALQGLRAVVTLNDGRVVEVGNLDKLQCGEPLRFVQLVVDSAASAMDEPTVTLELCAEDVKLRCYE